MQAANETVVITRRPLDVEDYIDMVRRNKAWIVGTTLAALVVSVVAACLWPNTYVSEAIIRVQMPLVSERYVPSIANMDVMDRINSIIPYVLRPDSLQAIMERTGVYKKELASEAPLDVATKMQSHIAIGRVVSIQATGTRAPVAAFKVSFEYPDRRLATAVTRELVTGFLDQDTMTRVERSSKTTDFIGQQSKAAKEELDRIEGQLAEFRSRNAGRLPDELQTNIQALRSLETQLSTITDSIRRIDQDMLLLTSQERIFRDQMDALTSPAQQLASAVKSDRLGQVGRDIQQLEASLAAAKERYTDAHPDVQALQSQLAALKRTKEELTKQAGAQEPEPKASPSAAELRSKQQIEMNIASVHAQIEARKLEREERLKDQKRLIALQNDYNRKIEAGPALQQEYAKLSRDYAMAKLRYEDLAGKQSQSQAATQLDKQLSGERLEILSPPSMPQTPAKPDRLLIIGIGTAFGLIASLFIVAGREVKNTALKSLKDARIYTNLPVLGTVPLLENALVTRRKRRLVWLAWSAACLLGIIAMSASFVYYYTTSRS